MLLLRGLGRDERAYALCYVAFMLTYWCVSVGLELVPARARAPKIQPKVTITAAEWSRIARSVAAFHLTLYPLGFVLTLPLALARLSFDDGDASPLRLAREFAALAALTEVVSSQMAWRVDITPLNTSEENGPARGPRCQRMMSTTPFEHLRGTVSWGRRADRGLLLLRSPRDALAAALPVRAQGSPRVESAGRRRRALLSLARGASPVAAALKRSARCDATRALFTTAPWYRLHLHRRRALLRRSEHIHTMFDAVGPALLLGAHVRTLQLWMAVSTANVVMHHSGHLWPFDRLPPFDSMALQVPRRATNRPLRGGVPFALGVVGTRRARGASWRALSCHSPGNLAPWPSPDVDASLRRVLSSPLAAPARPAPRIYSLQLRRDRRSRRDHGHHPRRAHGEAEQERRQQAAMSARRPTRAHAPGLLPQILC